MNNIINNIYNCSQQFQQLISDDLKDDSTSWLPWLVISSGIAFTSFVYSNRQQLLERIHPIPNACESDLARTERKLARVGFFIAEELDGVSKIFINQNEPRVLIKYPGYNCSTELDDRLERMKICRKFCEKNGFKSLVIPRAIKKDNYLKEERLPISSSLHDQMGLYLHNLDIFTDAVVEFVKFLCHAHLGDLIGQNNLLSPFSEIPVGRYDNVPLYIEERKGKIGLVDLEQFWLDNHMDSPTLNHVSSACETVITLYPFHFDSIIKTAEEINPDIKNERAKLEQIKVKALRFFEKAYVLHEKFLKEHGITAQNPAKSVEMKESVKCEIVNSLIEKMYKPLNVNDKFQSLSVKEYYFSSALNEENDETCEVLRTIIFPMILDHIENFNHKRFKYLISEKMKQKNDTAANLLKLRSIRLNRYETPYHASDNKNEKVLLQTVTEELSKHSIFNQSHLFSFAEWITDSIYLLLKEKKIIAEVAFRAYGKSDLILF